MNLADRVILLVGGLGDLTTSIALRLVEDGASVVIAGDNKNQGHKLIEQVESTGGNVAFTSTKPESESEAQCTIAEAIMTFGSIDGLVTLAGATEDDTDQAESDHWQQTVDRDLRTAWLAAKFAMPFLRSSSAGAMVCLMSHAGLTTTQDSTLSSVTQAGLQGLCRSLAVNYGPAGIRVNGIVVGPIEDENLAARLAQKESSAAAVARLTRNLPLGRIGSPREVAPAVSFLLSPDASWISGTILHVDGGANAASGIS